MFIIFIISGEASLCCLALEPCRVSLYKWCYFFVSFLWGVVVHTCWIVFFVCHVLSL